MSSFQLNIRNSRSCFLVKIKSSSICEGDVNIDRLEFKKNLEIQFLDMYLCHMGV